ncbi:hypothetical protein OIE63_15290 [Streptomyces sp. NBC_01795]|uniref:hypothetical protein n=1 Tax=unclassified Streptomyces TaxID=2593676 RepID=UPI002DD9A696|nr:MULTISPECIES: hypothetical protein [unclassified Streptomyces]WSA92774.1 hypothetical protein OIE63_15290 [Streptomyces sp. NBC_01795]WSS14590.1 hypothetical protein OG533_23850 [Streptomyces sp. NBC_01186]
MRMPFPRAVRVLRRLALHEIRCLTSIAMWLARRRSGVRPGDLTAPYAAAQASTMLLFGFITVVETVALSVLLAPWPMVHMPTLVLDVYGVVFVIGLHAASVVRPHLVGADGSLRVRYAALADLRVPAGLVASAHAVRRYPDAGMVDVTEDTLTLPVAGQTSVTVHLSEPVTFVRPLGAEARIRTLHLHSDTPEALVAALTGART